ncbi:hypothetical protein [Haloarcula litorea]|uniref:hypothetical protein n=1 Tax=Haloarcula litorea TaxID=3032579 RepID=UPI0023E8E1F0|nr:hypothetical protein [Halomicroarcula sp. GDY20]
MNKELYDGYGVPKAYKMVEALEKAAEDHNVDLPLSGETQGEELSYFSITGTIREELTVYLGVDEAMQVQDLLLEKKFDEVYDLLDQHWEDSVREMVPDERIEGWEPHTTS